MKRIKRFSCAIAVLVLLVMQANPALAKFGGTLRTHTPWTLVIQGGAYAAVTVTFVDSRGRQEIDLFTAPAGEDFFPYFQSSIPRGTRRVIFDLDFVPGSSQEFLTSLQGTSVISVDICAGADCASGSARVVFDVVPPDADQ